MTTEEERRAAGRRINADTAEVWFEYGQTLDPYGERSVSDDDYQIGRVFFAMDPIERIPVCFYDLDEPLRLALTAKRDQADREGWNAILNPDPTLLELISRVTSIPKQTDPEARAGD
jgi:hypothetical protein